MAISRGRQAFPRDEYLRRLSLVKSEMASREVQVLVVSDQHNITYLTGYTARSAYVPQALVVAADEEEPVFILRRMDAPAALHQCFMGREKIIGYPEELIAHPTKDGYDAVVDYLEAAGLEKHGIGIEQYNLSTLTVEKFKRRLAGMRFVDCTKMVTWARLVKSDLEIEVMREAAAISDAAIARAAEVLRSGVREADACAEIASTLIRGVNGKPGTRLEEIVMCSSPRTGTCHIPWSEDDLRDGSQVNIEIAGSRHGYCAALMRTYSIGAPSDRLRRVHDIQLEGLEAALRAVLPGATCSDVANAFYRTIERKGLKKESRCGYAQGIGWTEPTASLRDGDMTVLKPNMTFHLMLGNWIDEDFGYVISETFRVTSTGVEVLTKSPRQIYEIT
ncbi:M24 family metallopeptidase [Phyllobacterium zundukense]|uniref:Xaa-Pro peptidase family protein n=1 Tax=Phyllobacterium zundukense TaxID=1867719 RepID=A0ACD4CVH3_9HYPH|nr:Xaa-Pro peptidase family protein [Phyllobacterium zundukense]UXN57585.1 Xaa-Pro peptidase family protein [Phyllobacterium zundukense]